ncbi:BTH_I0359 family protein [Undibacterium sp. WLX3042]|uniref:BTH_I0359 family protein n=1 Tax=Undibacterium sp. WLX3042 TaxID=3412686 RepID=UPI003C2F7F62
MNLIYNSENYSVVEYSEDAEHEALRFGGYEITDKAVRREWFIGGPQALSFRHGVTELIASEPSIEEIDDFLGQYDGCMRQSVLLH